MLNSLYKNGFTAKAAVQYTGDLNSEAEQNFLRGLEAYATGKMDATKTFIPVPLGSKIEALNIKLTDSQFIELRKQRPFRSRQPSASNPTRSTTMKIFLCQFRVPAAGLSDRYAAVDSQRL